MFDQVLAIGRTTFRESIRGKILYTLGCFALAVVGFGALFGAFSIGSTGTFVKDFAILATSWFVVAFAVFSGSSFLEKEVARRTIFTILSKSVTRSEFILGKYFGMLGTIALMLTMVGALLLGGVFLAAGTFDFPLFQALVYLFLELSIICAGALFFSSIVVTPSLAGFFTLGLFLVGRSAQSILYFITVDENITSGMVSMIKGVYWLIPHLDSLYVGNEAAFGISQSLGHFGAAVAYSAAYSALLLTFANFAFARRQFQ